MTYNCAQQIGKTLQSIERQDYPEIELVVADGGSSDGTLEIIAGFAAKSKYEYRVVSEKDKGLYNALNKDVARATGDYLLVMNDQLLKRNAVRKLVEAIENEGTDGAHSDLIYATDDEVVRYWHMGKGKILSGWMPGHPTLMLKREVYETYGNYKEDYASAADYEFMVRILKNGEVQLSYVPGILVRMYYGGTSTTSMKSYIRSLREGHRALIENGFGFFPACIADILRTVRVCLQFARKTKVNDKWKKRNSGIEI